MSLKRLSVEELFELIPENTRIHINYYTSIERTGNSILFGDFAVLEKSGLVIFNDRSRYFNVFPENEDTPEQILPDMVDLIQYYYITAEIGVFALSRTPSGRISAKARNFLRERLACHYNAGTARCLEFIQRNFTRSQRESLFADNFFSVCYGAFEVPLLTPSPPTYINLESHRGLPPELWYIFRNKGLIWHEESGSWWTPDKISGDGTIPDWERKKPETCSDCGKTVSREDSFKGRCIACLNIREEDLQIRGYNAKAPDYLKFKGGIVSKKKEKIPFKKYYKEYLTELSLHTTSSLEDNTLYLGLELEYEYAGDQRATNIQIMKYLNTHAILKQDGSLSNGVEIVTCPATLTEHKKIFEPFFKNFPSTLSTAESCGLHIHISRSPLSLLTQGKLIEFMNKEENKKFIKKIAGRWSERWAKQDSSRNITYILKSCAVGNRYSVLNTNNKDTLEFRIFAPAKTWNKFIYKLEFCVALVEYCKPCSTNLVIKESTLWNNFENWLKDKRKEYPNLCDFLFKKRKIDSKWTKKETACA